MVLVKAESLSMKQGAKYILKDIDWEINSGENWVVFGLNGCGKTSLLSILSGYKSSNQGKHFLFDEEVTEENFLSLRKHVGLVSSSFFDQYFSCEIVLDIVLAGEHGSLGFQEDSITDADVRRGKKILREFGLENRIRYPYDTLSKGQRQMVLIARALMGNPKVLILDEPCSGLDLLSREKFLHVIQNLAVEQGTTIIYVTHHTEEIPPFFTKAMLMKTGQIHSKGDLQKVFSSENLTDFLGVESEVIWSEEKFFIKVNLR